MVNILYFEDDFSHRLMLGEYLAFKKYNVESYAAPNVFLKEYSNLNSLKTKLSEFNIILSDIMMPEMDGLEFLEYLRKNKIDTPILFISSMSDAEKLNILKEKNLDNHGLINKPIKLSELEQKIQSMLNKKLTI